MSLVKILPVAAILVCLTASAGVPQLISYQGRLTDAAGDPLPDGPKSVRFIIWDDPASSLPANEIWNSGPVTVTTTDGLFVVNLGESPMAPLVADVAADTARWLGITVGADPEINPRTRLVATPFSLRALHADTADHGSLTGLDDDDHPQYLPIDGSRPMTGTLTGIGMAMGDSAIRVAGNSVGIGFNFFFPSDATPLKVFRVHNSSSSVRGISTGAQNLGSGEVTGISSGAAAFSTGDVRAGYFDADVSSAGHAGYRRGLDVRSGNPSLTDGFSYGIDVASFGGLFSYGIRATASNGAFGNWAGYFTGDVNVTGTLSKAAGSFKIDHPLDPENKYLQHSFVESPDMMNIYNGNVVTDNSGYAVVTMPDYFESLNRDFRYQLTVIGDFARAIVATEISDGQFAIRTDKPNIKVSWQVTGVRHDPYAAANRIEVELDKPEHERGYYQNPEAFGLSVEYSIDRDQLLDDPDRHREADQLDQE